MISTQLVRLLQQTGKRLNNNRKGVLFNIVLIRSVSTTTTKLREYALQIVYMSCLFSDGLGDGASILIPVIVLLYCNVL